MTTLFTPARLDTRAFAKANARLSGIDPLSQFDRLRPDVQAVLQRFPGAAADALSDVAWEAIGVWVEQVGRGQAWLALKVELRLPQVCQRCLTPVPIVIEFEREFRFVNSEEEAERLDDESEEDLLVHHPEFNLLSLVEDEIIMALPLVPMHEVCGLPAEVESPQETDETGKRPNPFAVLAGLKRR